MRPRRWSGPSATRAFERAIRELVRPGDRVLDLGTGLGTYAFFAARAGAGRVWGVDSDPVVHVAEQAAGANGLAERVTFLRGTVPGVELPSQMDVLIFEDFPGTLFDGPTHRVLGEVIDKVLATGGRMIPVAGRMSVAPVHSEAHHGRIFPLAGTGWTSCELDWSALRPLLANTPRRDDVLPEHLLAPPLRSSVVPLVPVPGAQELRVEGWWNAASPGRIHALTLWFDLEVSPGNWISNEPRPSPEPWGQWILPLDPPLDVAAPGRVEVSVGREAQPSGGHGWLTWDVRWEGEVRRGHEFAGLALGLEDLGRPVLPPRQPVG